MIVDEDGQFWSCWLEINILRERAGLPERTADQIITGIKGKLRG